MMTLRRRTRGYTLIEAVMCILVSSIIFGLLLISMRTSVSGAKAEEAIAQLEAIRASMMTLHHKTGVFNKYSDGTFMPAVPFQIAGNLPDFPTGSLNGLYFVDSDYVMTVLPNYGNGFTVRVTGSKSDVAGISYTIDQFGTITKL